MKFEIIKIAPRLPWPLHHLLFYGYSVSVRFEDGKQAVFHTYSPNSHLFFFTLSRAVFRHLQGEDVSDWDRGIKNLLVTNYDFDDEFAYQNYESLFRTGKKEPDV